MALPEYLVAADNHNIGNTQTSWLDLDQWTQKFGNAGSLAATSVLSGLNSFYNTGVTVGNWFGAGLQENDTQSWISGIDGDLGSYYRENKSAADLGGFVLGSLIPGLGATKLLNAGQTAIKTAKATGLLGGNLGRAMGVLVPDAQKFTTLAAAEINASTTALKLINTNTVKSLGAGVWQNTLEAAAFETAVQVTMFKSPVLEDQDIYDIATNVAVGGALGGLIGGAFTAAKLGGKLKAAVRAEDEARLPFTNRPSFAAATEDSEKIVQLAYDSQMAARPVPIQGPDGLIVNNYSVNKQLFEEKIRKNNNDIRTSIHNMTGTDTELGNIVANTLHGADAQTVFGNMSGAAKIVRVTETTALEKAQIKAAKEGLPIDVPVATRLVKNIGEDAGQVIDEMPSVLSLGDLFKGRDEILNKARSFGFSVGKAWDPLKLVGPAGHIEGQARHIWAEHILKEIPKGTNIAHNDIPLLERVYKDGNWADISIVKGEGPSLEVTKIASKQEMEDILFNAKIDTAYDLVMGMSLKKGLPTEQGMEAAAKIVNARREFLEGTSTGNKYADMMATQADNAAYQKMIQDKQLTRAGEGSTPVEFLPKYSKVVYAQSQNVIETHEHIVDAMVFYKSKQKEYEQAAKNVVAKNLGVLSDSLLPISDTALSSASRNGSGAGLFSFENSNYGTLGSSMAVIGSVTARSMEASRKKIGDYLGATLTRLGNKPEAALEFESINQQVTRSAKQWKLDRTNRVMYSVEKAGVEPDILHLKLDETIDALESHITLSGGRTSAWKEMNAVKGHTDGKLDDVYRPIRPDLKQYPHFFFVRDPQVTGTGHMSMVHAATEKELGALRDRVPSNYEVVFKTDAEEFKKARGEYEFSRTLHENYIDSDLKNRGVFSNFFPKSDPQKIIDDVIQQHYRESDVLNRELVRFNYESQFSWLEDQGRSYSRAETSQFASSREMIENTADNPYFNYIKTALNISKAPEMGLLYSFNKTLDTAVSKAVGAVRNVFADVKTPAELEQINGMLDKYGMKPAYYDASLHLLANHTAPRGELTKFVRGANSLLSMFTLGLDPLNSLNNAIGANILRMTELKHLTRAINNGDAEIAGALGGLAKVATPGTGDSILAPSKLVGKAIQNFWKDDGTLIGMYRNDGLIKDRVEQLKLLVDDFTLQGTESVADLNNRMSKGFSKAKALFEVGQTKGEKLSANKLAEEFNRFISADVMRQITDIGVDKGLMDAATAKSYINTFVNRVEGNITASQRPLIFQGPVGQAIGLFQSYQFNLLQQLFRYSAEGSAKDLGMLLGLQSTLYGLQSLPAFQFINTHVVGQLSGNKEHRDLYDATYGTVGRTAGDWMLYGIPSNLLQANIYSRGDINPRQITVLPTSMQEIPLVQGWGKFLANIKNTTSNIANGGDVWNSLLQGLEHNGVSRPLAGFAQVFGGLGDGVVESTTKNGSILASNDLMSWASVTRMAGGRPLDEAITNDAMFRVKSYEAARKQSMASLAETVRTTMVGGQVDQTSAEMNRFAEKYAALGGKQAGFNKWMMGLYKQSNTEQSEVLAQSLKTPYAYKMQLLMGGEDE